MDEFRECFPFMRDILCESSGKEYAEMIDARRDRLYSRDKTFLRDTGRSYQINNIELIDGYFVVHHKGWHYDCLLHQKNGPLFVILNAALSGTVPEFKRWTYYQFLPGSMLNIADPMYRAHKALKLGWWYGDEENNLRQYTAELILKIAKMMGISNHSIYLIGSSGGGAAAIQVGHLIPGSTVIAINAQIKLSLYYYHEVFTQITGINVTGEDKFGRNDTVELLREQQGETKYLLISNVKSYFDVVQIEHMKRSLNKIPSYGLSMLSDNAVLWLYDAVTSHKGGPHGAQEYHEMLYAILSLAHYIRAGKDIENVKELYLCFTELWRDHFLQIEKGKNELRALQSNNILVNLNLSDETLFQATHVIQVPEIRLAAKEDEQYKCYELSAELEPDTIYCLYIGNSVSENHISAFTILLKNIKQNINCYRTSYKVGESVKLYFKTGMSADDLKIRIYCGGISKTAGNEFRYKDVRLIDLSH